VYEIFPMCYAFLSNVVRVCLLGGFFFFFLCYRMGLCEWHKESHSVLLSMLEFVCSFHVCGSDLVDISDWHATSKYFGSLISFFITLKLTSSVSSHV
jgi:hypothetical protein